MDRSLSYGQLVALTFVSMLSPFLRLIPGAVTSASGSAAWVSAALSLILICLLSAALTTLVKRSPGKSGLASTILHTLGRFPGSVVLCVWSVWLVFHSSFLLCSGADRFVATIYPGIRHTMFILVTAAICLIAALGQIKAIARTSEIFRPLLLFVLLLVIHTKNVPF